MIETPARVHCFVIMADESANWKVAGLRQLDRIALALNEYFEAKGGVGVPRAYVFWRGSVPEAQRQLPQHPRLTLLHLTNDVDFIPEDPGAIAMLSTRLFVTRHSIAPLLDIAPPMIMPAVSQDEDKFWQACFAHCEKTFRSHQRTRHGPRGWRYMTRQQDGHRCERLLLRDSGKPQDGVISRFLNRPLTRPVTHLLLKLPVTPSKWTLLIALLPIAGAVALLVGSYWGFVWGLIFYQIYSMLDGCDGEIARAKYLEARAGQRLDSMCDFLGNLLLMVALGFGLSHTPWIAAGSRNFYLIEGIVAALLTVANETLLLRKSESDDEPILLNGMLYARHRHLVRRSGLLFFGENVAGWLVQLTKRDVAIFVFLLLAIVGRPQWILHLFCAVALVSLALAMKASARRRGADAL